MRPLLCCLAAAALTACGGTNPAVMCTAEQTSCSGACADLRTDNQHCGACGNACGAGDACGGSMCWPRACDLQTCAEGLVCVDDVCVDRECFAVECPAGQRCAGGACYAQACNGMTCPAGQLCVDDACADASCIGVICPAGLQCSRGACFADTCGDGLKSGAESDTDCGGPVCRPCGSGQSCTVPLDCQSKVCTAMTCVAPTCTDRVRNGQEGDVDCGGACPLCDDGMSCSQAAQCQSGSCTSNRCTPPSCTDLVKNGTETDRDCGGGCATKCAEGQACAGSVDCVTANCAQQRCVSSMCLDGAKNGSETDVDCGSNCAPCIDGKICAAGMDCVSGVCSAAMRCVAPNCTDMVKNGLETDLDCGGPCMSCGAGRKCKVANDCLSRSCQNLVCQAPSCGDGVANGQETDVDCGGGGACPRCAPMKSCLAPTDCASGGCTMMRCDTPLIFWAPVNVPVGAGPRQVTVNDVDNDGLLDVIASNYGSYDVSLMYQQLDGGLTAPLTLGLTTSPNVFGPTSVSVGDLNGDGFKDLIVPRYANFNGSNYQAWAGCRIGILKGLGNRQFLGATDSEWAPERSGCGWTSALVRLNADPLVDLVASDGIDTASYTHPRTTPPDSFGGWTFNQAGDGGFAIPAQGYLEGAGPHLAVGDVNNDGNADVLGHSNNTGQVRTWLGRGDGTFMPYTSFGVGPGYGAVVLANFNADNNLDVAVASEGAGVVSVAIGLGNGLFIAPVTYAVPTPFGLAASDIDGDGKLDLVAGTTGVAVLYGVGDGTFRPQQTVYASLGRIHVLATGDLNGDSRNDVAVISGGVVKLLYNRAP